MARIIPIIVLLFMLLVFPAGLSAEEAEEPADEESKDEPEDDEGDVDSEADGEQNNKVDPPVDDNSLFEDDNSAPLPTDEELEVEADNQDTPVDSIPINNFSKPRIPTFGGFGGGYLGMIYLNLEDIEDFIEDQDKSGGKVDSLNPVMVTYGLQGYGFIYERFVFGGQGGGFGQWVDGDRIDLSVSGYFGWLEFGYNVVHSLYFTFRPSVGFGGMGTSIIIDGDLRSLEFVDEEDRQDDNERAELFSQTAFGTLGLTIEGTPYFRNDRQTFSGMAIGLRIGWFQEFYDAPWGYRDERVKNGPKVHATGFYATLNILFGGGSTEKEKIGY